MHSRLTDKEARVVNVFSQLNYKRKKTKKFVAMNSHCFCAKLYAQVSCTLSGGSD